MANPIAITGVGLLTVKGDDLATLVKPAMHTPLPVKEQESPEEGLVWQVPLDLKARLTGTGWRHHTRSALMACVAAQAALRDAGMAFEPMDKAAEGMAVILGYNTDIFSPAFQRALKNQDLLEITPPYFLSMSVNAVASQVSIWLKIQGFALTLTSGFTAGLESLAAAAQALELGRAQAVLAGGVEEATQPLGQSFALQNQEAGHVPGVVPAEGCGLLLLEQEALARARGARPRAWLDGYGWAAARGAAGGPFQTAIELALQQAGIGPEQIDIIFSAANGDAVLDEAEARGVSTVFGKHRPASTAVKSWIGETLHAGGSLAAALAIGFGEQCVLPAPGWNGARAMQRILVLAADRDRKAAAVILRLPQRSA